MYMTVNGIITRTRGNNALINLHTFSPSNFLCNQGYSFRDSLVNWIIHCALNIRGPKTTGFYPCVALNLVKPKLKAIKLIFQSLCSLDANWGKPSNTEYQKEILYLTTSICVTVINIICRVVYLYLTNTPTWKWYNWQERRNPREQASTK